MFKHLSHAKKNLINYIRIRSCRHLSDSLPDDNDAIIIGGGVAGVSIAYHLAKAGLKKVLLLEKTELTAGSTWHAAGLTTYYNPGINAKKIHFYSLELYKNLEKETGQNVGLHECGSLRIAETFDRLEEFHQQMSRQRWNEAKQWIVYPEEIKTMNPLLNMDTVIAGLYNPGDGHIDPYSLTQALAIGARNRGAQIRQKVEVKATEQLSNGGWSVDTNRGSIKCKHLINAAGFWAREVGKLSGLDLPLVPIHHQYLITSPIPQVQDLAVETPVIRDLDGSYYLRQERGGLLMGPYEHQDTMVMCEDWFDNGVPKGFGKELFDADLERLQPHIEKCMRLVPAMKDAQIQRVISGPITYTPDLLPLVGPVHPANNYWCAVGLSYGIIHGGGVGKYLSDWLVNGEPSFDLIEFDPNRFSTWTDRKYILAKARESYGLNNLTVYPKEERPAGRPAARSHHLLVTLRRQGAEFGFHAGWEQANWFSRNRCEAGYRPSFHRTNWFSAVGSECRHVTQKVGIIDLSPFGKFTVEGADANQLLDLTTANSMPKVGRTCISHVLTERGRVYAELTLTRLAVDKYFCVTGSASELHDLRYLDNFAKENLLDVQIQNVTNEYGCLGVVGPLARDLLSKLTQFDLSDQSYSFLRAERILLADTEVLAIRISYTGELGWELYVPMSNIKHVYDKIMQVGSALDIRNFGTFAMNSLRMEKGFRAWGSEMNMDTNPLEAGLQPFLKLNKKADFVGKKVLQKLKSEPLVRSLVHLEIQTDNIDAAGNETIWHQDKVVGNTTSGSYGYISEKSLAMGYVPIHLCEDGQKVEVELIGRKYAATINLKPPLETQPQRDRKPL